MTLARGADWAHLGLLLLAACSSDAGANDAGAKDGGAMDATFAMDVFGTADTPVRHDVKAEGTLVALAAGPIDDTAGDDVVTVSTTPKGFLVQLLDGPSGAPRRTSLLGLAADGGTGATPHAVAVADVDEDGHADVWVASSMPGETPRVVALRGPDFGVSGSSYALGDFAGPVSLAAVDVNGDGAADLVVAGPSSEGSKVRVLDGTTGAEVGSFFAFDPAFRGGVFVAAGDVDGDGAADVVVGQADGPKVRVLAAKDGQERFAWTLDGAFAGGVRVAVGDVSGDGRAEIVVGAASGGPAVRVLDGKTGTKLRELSGAQGTGTTGGALVATANVDGQGSAEIVVVPAPGATSSKAR